MDTTTITQASIDSLFSHTNTGNQYGWKKGRVEEREILPCSYTLQTHTTHTLHTHTHYTRHTDKNCFMSWPNLYCLPLLYFSLCMRKGRSCQVERQDEKNIYCNDFPCPYFRRYTQPLLNLLSIHFPSNLRRHHQRKKKPYIQVAAKRMQYVSHYFTSNYLITPARVIPSVFTFMNRIFLTLRPS